jgi:enamine deaminase RidA (YjgF/YER057c/UK114 family)
MSFDDVVKIQIFLRDISDAKVVSSIRDELLTVSKPASTMVEVSGFVKGDCLLEIDMVAAKPKK